MPLRWGSRAGSNVTIGGLDDAVEPGSNVKVAAISDDGQRIEFEATLRIDTAIEAEYYRHGGLAVRVAPDDGSRDLAGSVAFRGVGDRRHESC